VLDAEERAGEVRVEHEVPGGLVQLEERDVQVRPQGPRVVDENVEPPEAVEDLVHGAPDLFGAPDVRLHHHRPAPERAAAAGRLLGARQVRVAEHGHVGARLGEPDRLGTSDPGRPAGHERNPSGVSHVWRCAHPRGWPPIST
jgi:hypothetical protein